MDTKCTRRRRMESIRDIICTCLHENRPTNGTTPITTQSATQRLLLASPRLRDVVGAEAEMFEGAIVPEPWGQRLNARVTDVVAAEMQRFQCRVQAQLGPNLSSICGAHNNAETTEKQILNMSK